MRTIALLMVLLGAWFGINKMEAVKGTMTDTKPSDQITPLDPPPGGWTQWPEYPLLPR